MNSSATRARPGPLQPASKRQSLSFPLHFAPGADLATPAPEGKAMYHPDTQFLIDHWTGLSNRPGSRGGVPDRAALQPDALGRRLPRVFMARRTGDDAVIRLAGGWIEGFHSEPLKDRLLSSLWRETSRSLLSAALTRTAREARPVVIIALAGDTGVQMEVILAPLRGPSGESDRLLGLYAPASALTLAKDDSRLLVARLAIGVGDSARAPLSLAADRGRRLA